MLSRLLLTALAGFTLGAQDFQKDLEEALQASTVEGMRRCMTRFDSEPARQYITKLGTSLARQLPDTPRDLTFEIAIDGMGQSTNPTHEPLLVRSGSSSAHMFVPVSLIRAANSEAELAGQVAHALAHPRNPQRGAGDVRVYWTNDRGWCGAGVIPGKLLEAERGSEIEADHVAVQAIGRAGYSPKALPDYLSRVHPQESGERARFSWLPPRAERLGALAGPGDPRGPGGSALLKTGSSSHVATMN